MSSDRTRHFVIVILRLTIQHETNFYCVSFTSLFGFVEAKNIEEETLALFLDQLNIFLTAML